MIDRASGVILPLMHHLVQQSLNRLLPTVPSDMTAAYHDLGGMSRLTAKRVMTKSRLHAAGDADRNCGQFAAEFRSVQLAMRTGKLAHEMQVRRSARPRRSRRLEIEREL